MVNINKFLDEYRKDTIVNYFDDCVIIGLPFFHYGHDESIAIRIDEKEDGLVLSDCHTTEDYLEAQGVELADFGERLEKIIKRFGLVHDGNVFRKIVPSPVENSFKRYLGYFIQALSIIANIDL